MVLKRFRIGQASPNDTSKDDSQLTEECSDEEDDAYLNKLISNNNAAAEDISTILYGESVGSNNLRAKNCNSKNAKALRKQSRMELDRVLPNTTLTTKAFNFTDISLIGGSMDEGSVIIREDVKTMSTNISTTDRTVPTKHRRRPSGQSAFEENVEVFKYSRRGLLQPDGMSTATDENPGGQDLSTDLSIFCLSLLQEESAPRAKTLSERVLRDSLQRHFDLFMQRKANDYITEPVDYANRNNVPATPMEIETDPQKLKASALSHLTKGEYQEAIEVMTRLLKVQKKMAKANTSETLSRLAILHLSQGHLNRSNIFAKEALRQNREDSHRAEASINLMMIGLIYFRGNKSEKALSTWREAMQIACSVFGYDHPYVAVLLNNLGCLYYEQGDFAACLRSFSESLDLQRSFLKASSGAITDLLLLDVAITKGNIAIVTSRDGSIETPMSLLEEVLTIQESVLGHSNHFLIEQTKYTMECLGGTSVRPSTTSRTGYFSSSVAGKHTMTSQGAYLGPSRSFPYETGRNKNTMIFGDNDGIPMRRSGADSSMYAMNETDSLDFMELGLLASEVTPKQRVRAAVLAWFGKQLQDDEATHLPFVPAFDIGQRTRLRAPIDLDQDNVVDAELYLESIHQQAQDHLEYNETSEAISLFQSVLRSHEDKYGEIHHLVGTAYHNLGLVYLFDEKYQQAKEYFLKAVHIRKSALEDNHPDVAASLTKVAMIDLACRDSELARDLFVEVSRTLPMVFGYNSIHVARAMTNLSVTYYDLGSLLEANRACREARDILRLLLKDVSPSTACGDQMKILELALASSLSNLGFLECRQRRYPKAVELFTEAAKLRKKHLGVSHHDLNCTNRNLDYAQKRLVSSSAAEALANKEPDTNLSNFIGGFLCAYGN